MSRYAEQFGLGRAVPRPLYDRDDRGGGKPERVERLGEGMQFLIDLGVFGVHTAEEAANPTGKDAVRKNNEIKNSKLKTTQELETRGFSWINMATTDIPIGRALDAVGDRGDYYHIPATGHMGGIWARSASGNMGELTYRPVSLQHGHAKPVLLDIGQTPTRDGQGDTLFLPGTVFPDPASPQAVELPFLAYNNATGQFEAEDRNRTLFAPYVMTEVNGQRVPLVAAVKGEMAASTGREYDYIAEVAVRYEPELRGIYNSALTHIANLSIEQPQEAAKLLRYISDRTLLRNGAIERNPEVAPVIRVENGTFMMGEHAYADVTEVIDGLLLPMKVAAQPELLNNVASFPEATPFFSKEMMIAAIALLNGHYDGHVPPGSGPMQDVNVHLHYGGIQMAGAPPKDQGYFKESIPRIRNLISFLRDVHRLPDGSKLPPLYFALMPGTIFNLCPSEGATQDIAVVTQLIAKTREYAGPVANNSSNFIKAVERAVAESADALHTVSTAFAERFMGGHLPTEPAASSTYVMPEGFRELTMKEACMLVGTLREHFAKQADQPYLRRDR